MLREVTSQSPARENVIQKDRDALPGWELTAVLLATLVLALSQTMVAPAIADIATHFDTGRSSAAWVLTGFLLSASVATPVIGKLGDVYGKRNMLILTMVVFAIGSTVAALAGSIGLLIAGRVIQGVGGGVFPLSFGIIRDNFPARRVPMGLSMVSAMFGIGGGLGLPLAGVIVDNVGLAWLFWPGLLGLVVAVVALLAIPHHRPDAAGMKLDWLGALLLSAALVALLVGISQANAWGWSSVRVVSLLVGAVVLMVVWVLVELRTHDPLVEMRVLAQRPVAMTNLAGLLVGFGMFSAMLLMPQYVETPERVGYGFGVDVTQAGLLLLPMALFMLVFGPLAGRIGPEVGFRLVLALGGLAGAAGMVWVAVSRSHQWDFVVAGSLLGIGIALGMAAMANIIVDAVPGQEVGIATGINTITRTVGGALGTATVTAILTSDTLPHLPVPVDSAYRDAFLVGAAACISSALAAVAVPRKSGVRSAGE